MRQNQWFLRIAAIILFLTIPYTTLSAATVNYTIRINSGENGTTSRKVLLHIYPPKGATEMRISNNAQWTGSYWESAKRSREWLLDFEGGTKRVVVQFRDKDGHSLPGTYEDDIYLAVPRTMTVDAKINNGDIQTTSRHVTLSLFFSNGVEAVAISPTDNFTNVPFIPIEKTMEWVLPAETGGKDVYLQFRDANNNTKIVRKTIYYEQPKNYLPEGSLLKGKSDTVYYYGFDGKLHPFFHSSAYQSYFTSFNDIKYVSDDKLQSYPIAESVCVRPGTWLVKFKGSARVFAVEPGCYLRPIRSEAEAFLLYGPSWSKRLIELESAYAGFYRVRELTTEERANDRDRDGVPNDVEEEYGTSDSSKDTDEDALSDYEEIYFWFTDPTTADSDRDGMKDGKEIIAGRSPNGPGALEELPTESYTFPKGSIIYKWWDDKKYYYAHQDGFMYFLANRVTDKPFTTNNLQSRFVVSPPFEIDFEDRDGWHILEDQEFMKLPLTTRYGSVSLL